MEEIRVTAAVGRNAGSGRRRTDPQARIEHLHGNEELKVRFEARAALKRLGLRVAE